MRVYADLFFLLNAAADYALLLAAGRLAGVAASIPRLTMGAAFGGAYALAALVASLPAAFSWPAAAAAGGVMVVLAFAPRPPRVLLRLLAFLYGAAALASGLVVVCGYAVGGAGGGPGLPAWAVALALAGLLLLAAAACDLRRGGEPTRWLCPLEVELAGQRAACRALLDSGNRLSDPCGDGPAILVQPELLRPLVPEPLLRGLCAGPAAAAAALEARGIPPHWARRLRLVPYHALGGSGLLPALRPDAVWVGRGRRRRAVRAVLAVCVAPLDPAGGFRAVVPAVCLDAPLRSAEHRSPRVGFAGRGAPLTAGELRSAGSTARRG